MGQAARSGGERQWVLAPAGAPAPVIACLPHGGREFPDALTGDLAVSPAILWSDWLTRELYAFLPELGITTITTTLSRFVADVNRDPATGQDGGFWSCVISPKMPRGQPLYLRALSPGQISQRLRLAHEPFHQALDDAVERLLRQFPRLLVLDLHSFGVDLGGDVILGDRRGLTARPEAMALVTDALAGQGLSVRQNERFIGGWTVRRFAADQRVDAIQVELNQRCYLDLAARRYPGPPPAGDFAATQDRLRRALRDGVVEPLRARYATPGAD